MASVTFFNIQCCRRYLIALKLFFFFQLGASSCIVPYIPVFIQSLGLNAAENGLIFGALPFLALLSKPMVGWLSDKSQRPYLILRVSLILQLVFSFAVYFIPPISKEEIALDSSVSTIRFTTQFWLSGLLLIFGWIGYGAVTTQADAIAFLVVEQSPTKSSYGENRVYGTAGWALLSFSVGFAMDSYSDSKLDRNFLPAFTTFAVAALLALMCSFLLPTVHLSTKDQPGDQQASATAGIWTVLKAPAVLLFSAGTFVAGLNSGLLYGYLGWYQSELGASGLLLGLTVFVQCCYEAPLMAVSTWFVKKFGYNAVQLLMLLSFAIRFTAYAFISNPWMVLIIDCVHSVGYGLFYGALTSFANYNAPAGCAARLQGVLGAVYEGIGQGIGGVLAGFLYQKYGGPLTWLGYGAFSFGTSICYCVAWAIMTSCTRT